MSIISIRACPTTGCATPTRRAGAAPGAAARPSGRGLAATLLTLWDEATGRLVRFRDARSLGATKFLGRLRGNGTLVCGDETIGAADYDLDGYTTRPGEVVASGELRMPAADLQRSFGRRDLRLLTSDGKVFHLRFSGKPSDFAAMPPTST